MNTKSASDTIPYTIPFGEHTLRAVRYRHTAPCHKGNLFYLHGGGLVFGTSGDLPVLYRDMFLSAGYDLYLLDYPLAPESPLTEILDAVHASVRYLLAQAENKPYFLFGRSAGAYLALMEARRLSGSAQIPAGVLSFYGYRGFLLPEFNRPAPAYTRLPAVDPETVRRLTGGSWLTEGPMAWRYSIYVYARQTGTWPAFLGAPEILSRCSLTDEDLAQLPPGFFTASTGDQDVPFRESKQLAARVPGSRFLPVYYLEHDFDRDTTKKEGPQAYREAIAWMDSRLP